MMTLRSKRWEILVSDVEKAFEEFFGDNGFPSDEWPEVIRAFVSLVYATHVSRNEAWISNTKSLLEIQAEFTSALAKVVE